MTSPLLFVVIGMVEWLLAVIRVRACIDGRSYLAGGLVFLETLLGLWVFRQYAAGNDLAGIAYAFGGGLGTWLAVMFKPKKDNTDA